jgi:predicted enzyme related to lactoylglutathione lyase
VGLRNVGGMDIKISHSFITVDDQEKALAFYRDALGLVVNTDAPLGPYRWLTVSAPGNPNMEIVLATPDMGHGPDDTESLRMLLAKGALNGVLFTTDNCDAFFERVRATGAEVLQEPIDQPYGVRDCAFRDPAGNHVRIGSPIPQPS